MFGYDTKYKRPELPLVYQRPAGNYAHVQPVPFLQEQPQQERKTGETLQGLAQLAGMFGGGGDYVASTDKLASFYNSPVSGMTGSTGQPQGLEQFYSFGGQQPQGLEQFYNSGVGVPDGASSTASMIGPGLLTIGAKVGNEMYARDNGYRATDDTRYMLDLLTGAVNNQDIEKRLLPNLGFKENTWMNDSLQWMMPMQNLLGAL